MKSCTFMKKSHLKHAKPRNNGALDLPPNLTVWQVYKRLEKALHDENLLDSYFNFGSEPDSWLAVQPWAFIGQTRWLSCFATSQADGEAHNFWVILLEDTMHATIRKTTTICYGKTLLGKDQALLIANRCAILLDA